MIPHFPAKSLDDPDFCDPFWVAYLKFGAAVRFLVHGTSDQNGSNIPADDVVIEANQDSILMQASDNSSRR